MSPTLENLVVNTIRGLSMDAVQAANSGHPGLPMGAAPMAVALWTRHLKFNPKNPAWFDRDRFILSAGHGSMLLYSLLHLTGYDLPLEEIKNFRQWGSATPGHPENFLTPGVEMATGPLGQGFATSVGMAIAEKHLAAVYNKPGHEIVDHYTYGICSDGDLMEGVANEAASMAGHLKLGKLIYLYDDNNITIDGNTSLAFTENVAARFEAMDWHVQKIDGMNIEAVDKALQVAQSVTDKPSLICAKTTIGFGSPNRAGTSKAHGEALGEDEVKLSKNQLGIPQEPKFFIPEEVLTETRKAVQKGQDLERDWEHRFEAYAQAYPQEAAELKRAINGDFGQDWLNALPSSSEKIATRAASGNVINAIASHVPGLIGGSADLAGSNNTAQKAFKPFQSDTPEGRNLAYGVREHAMMAAVNGMTLHKGVRGYGATFLIFSDYCKASLRLAALMECPSIFIFTHDSIGLGEDGPTHQPIEQLASLRAIPNFNIIRPADANETAAAWKVALQSHGTPTAFALTRQGLPALTPALDNGWHPAERGAYVLKEGSSLPQCILVATGSEVSLAMESAKQLEVEGISTRVVSMPSWFLFQNEPAEYQESVLPRDIPTVSIEAASTFGWACWAQAHVGIDRFGASAPGPVAFEKFGFTVENVTGTAKILCCDPCIAQR